MLHNQGLFELFFQNISSAEPIWKLRPQFDILQESILPATVTTRFHSYKKHEAQIRQISRTIHGHGTIQPTIKKIPVNM